MNSIMETFKKYCKILWSRRKRLFLALTVFAALSAVSLYYLHTGGIKKIILVMALSFLTAASIVAPRIRNGYLTLVLTICYLIIVPGKLFDRIELPLHDMSLLIDGAASVNIMIIYLVYAVFLLLFQNTGVALGTGTALLGILSVINYFVSVFRGTHFSFYDIFAVKTAATILESYKLKLTSELWYSILYILCFTALGFRCGVVWKKKKWFHITATALSIAYISFFLFFWNGTDYLEEHELKGIHWLPSANQSYNGFLLSFAINMQEMYVAKPAGYSEASLLEIAEQAKSSYTTSGANTSEQQPNIILIMNESWADLSVLGNLRTSDSYTTTIDSLQNNVVKGNLHVNILGGLTANSEFEVLTGDSLAFLAHNAVPYQLQIDHAVPTLATVLKEQGYETVAIHPSVDHAWNRDEVYPLFGFDEFIDIYDFVTEYDYVRAYISDDCMFDEIIWRCENKQKDVPLFLFGVTIQNHGGYGGGVEAPITLEALGSADLQSYGDLQDADSFIKLMELTDQSFAKLIAYFEQTDEPTILCMFGDHQPKLSDEFYQAIFSGSELSKEEQDAAKYITPYVIWANFDLSMTEYGDMSANYLGAAVLECAGVELPAYYQYLLQLQKQYPVITYHTIDRFKKDEAITDYQKLQYNHLMDSNILKPLFSVAKEL